MIVIGRIVGNRASRCDIDDVDFWRGAVLNAFDDGCTWIARLQSNEHPVARRRPQNFTRTGQLQQSDPLLEQPAQLRLVSLAKGCSDTLGMEKITELLSNLLQLPYSRSSSSQRIFGIQARLVDRLLVGHTQGCC